MTGLLYLDEFETELVLHHCGCGCYQVLERPLSVLRLWDVGAARRYADLAIAVAKGEVVLFSKTMDPLKWADRGIERSKLN